MRLYYLLPLILGCQSVASSSNLSEEDAGTDVAPPHQNITIVGDSTAGYASWKLNDVRQPNETITVHYKGGTPITYWNDGHFTEALNQSPRTDVVIIFLGTVNFNFPWLPSVQRILNEVTARHLKCIWVGPTAVHGEKHVINTLLKNKVTPTCAYIDTESLNIPLGDGVHPTPDGTVKWLKEIWKVKSTL
jgi:hypothetical protein